MNPNPNPLLNKAINMKRAAHLYSFTALVRDSHSNVSSENFSSAKAIKKLSCSVAHVERRREGHLRSMSGDI